MSWLHRFLDNSPEPFWTVVILGGWTLGIAYVLVDHLILR